MKKIVLSLFVLAGAVTSMVSCSDETLDPVASVKNNIVVTEPNGGSFTLGATTAGDNVFTLKWTGADFGYNAAVTYKLQVIKASGSFTTPQELSLGSYNSNGSSSYEKAVTQRQLNVMLLGSGGSIGSTESYKLRVVGVPSTQLATSTNGVMSVSNEVSFSGNPYDTFDEFSRIYVPGGYQSASGYGNDWSPDNANVARLYSAGNDGKYEGFVWMNVSNPAFKFTPGPAWNGDKGDVSNPNTFTTLASPGNDIKPNDGAGTYFFTVDWAANTYTVAKRQVAIIGAATPNGWGTPTYMTFDTNPSSPYYQMYTIDIALAADEFLIRLKDDWSVKMGTLSGNVENTSVGGQYKIKLNGGNMKVPTAGNYKVVLDIRNSANYNIRLMPN